MCRRKKNFLRVSLAYIGKVSRQLTALDPSGIFLWCWKKSKNL